MAYDFEAEQIEDVQYLEEQSNTIRRLFQKAVPVFLKNKEKQNRTRGRKCFLSIFDPKWRTATIIVLA